MTLHQEKEQKLIVQSFIRGLEVIKTFGEGAATLSLSEVASRAGISRASARRLLHTLCDQGYARTDGKQFWLTPRILELGFSYLSSMEIWSFAQTCMEELVQRVHESCSIAVLDGYDIYYVMRVPTRKLLKSTLNVGSTLPAHVVSLGRIQLAELTDDELDHFLETANIEPYTGFTVTDKNRLREIIREDGAKGWSVVDRELEEGMCGISVPIHNPQGKTIAAINITLPPSKAAETGVLDYLRDQLQETASQIHRELARRQ
ncbi:IclR family transcriptional regulator C-terminal domain-containing protein [Marinobacter sp. ANT_B65]|uniref:IclR family transcriptional regulator domain-containing protein n=1 Tax=Marinobacter sp. ANT_B65 TaxID=2039467 RepID=UPI000BBEF3B3|nr:IclR family transcriptional regulator C-terminal domain-containing protein [Marinobacter sp. ANT_B65]PCM43277.1 IclR family transcriptional regulator [Marinobacter sp. ANT_B65]